MAIFGPKPWDNPFGKWQFFHFLFYSLERRFIALDYRKRNFSCLYLQKKKKSWKNGHFWTKTMGKCQFFYFSNFLFLQPRKSFFRSRISRKLEKWPFLDQNHGLAPLEKCQFFDFLNFLFIQPRRAFFRSRVWQKPFSWPLLLIKKKVEKWPFLEQNYGLNPFGKMSIFRFFGFLVFIAKKGVFSLQNIVKDIFLAYIS